jgi:hypothetical protein
MTKLLNQIMGWTILGLIVFAFIGRRNQEMIMTKLGIYFKADVQDLQNFINNMREDNASGESVFGYDKTKYSQETVEYFDEVAMGTEDGRRYDHVTRYTTDVKIYMEGHQPQYIVDELNSIVSELNGIINTVDVQVTNSKSDANMVISIGSLDKIKNEYPVFKNTIYQNANAGFSIGMNYSNVFLNTNNIRSVQHAKHVLREELTQAMGLMNDSYKYPESVFYQGVSETTEYAPIDRELIDILYNN